MAAEQAEVVGQDVTIERLAELRAQRTATDAAGQATENGTGYRTEGDTNRSGNSAERCAGLTTSEGSTDATCEPAHGSYGRAGLHGVME